MNLTKLFLTGTLALGAAFAQAQAPAKTTPATPAAQTQTAAPKASAAKTATPAPSAQDIADAKAKGMVWVNTNTKVYHKDGEFFGKTKSGKFMTEDDAKKAGYRAAKEPAGKKSAKAAPASK